MEKHPVIRDIKERIVNFYNIEFPLNKKNYDLLKTQLEDFILWESINPYLNKEIKIAKLLLKDMKINGEYSMQIKQITDGLGKWEVIVYKKISLIKPGNRHLDNLPLHKKHDEYFFVYVKELNFASNIKLKHPINKIQLAIQRSRLTEDILRADKKDPLSGHRFFLEKDSSAYPGSGIYISTGNHRLFELYWRYLAGLISGEELIELKNDQYLN